VPTPLVMAGEPICTPFPARGFMYVMWFAAATDGEIFDCDDRSGSLNDRRCVEPELIADRAVSLQSPVDFKPQSMGTNSAPDTKVPPGVIPQLYTQLIPFPAKARVKEGSLYDRPRLPMLGRLLLAVGLEIALETGELDPPAVMADPTADGGTMPEEGREVVPAAVIELPSSLTNAVDSAEVVVQEPCPPPPKICGALMHPRALFSTPLLLVAISDGWRNAESGTSA
jgi:hypothetical protein